MTRDDVIAAGPPNIVIDHSQSPTLQNTLRKITLARTPEHLVIRALETLKQVRPPSKQYMGMNALRRSADMQQQQKEYKIKFQETSLRLR